MRRFGKLDDDQVLIAVSRQDVDALASAVRVIHDLAEIVSFVTPDPQRSTLGASAGRPQAPRDSAVPSSRGQRAPKTAPAARPSRAQHDRNKKCARCGRAFIDDTKTNTRKWCAPGGCKRDTGPKESAIPHDESGRALRVGDSDNPGG